MTDTTKQQAVIYTRSAIAGDHASRADQEKRCSDYAARNGYKVVETFHDHGSGNRADRSGIRAMIGFLAAQDSPPPIVLIDDMFRLARSATLSNQLRDAIQFTGSRIVSPTMQGGAS